MKRLIIVRHGNTFRTGETPTRVGARTDLPLVEEQRARAVGKYLRSKNWIPQRILAAPLQRTMQTARLAIEEMNINLPIIPAGSFTEIDYGIDENKTEHQVLLRLGRYYLQRENRLSEETAEEAILARGEEALSLWNRQAIVPDGWQVDVETIIHAWRETADEIDDGETLMVVTSNGIIRFAPYILSDYETFYAERDIKVATGSVSVFEYRSNTGWSCAVWNEKAYKQY